MHLTVYTRLQKANGRRYLLAEKPLHSYSRLGDNSNTIGRGGREAVHYAGRPNEDGEIQIRQSSKAICAALYSLPSQLSGMKLPITLRTCHRILIASHLIPIFDHSEQLWVAEGPKAMQGQTRGSGSGAGRLGTCRRRFGSVSLAHAHSHIRRQGLAYSMGMETGSMSVPVSPTSSLTHGKVLQAAVRFVRTVLRSTAPGDYYS